MERRTSSAVNVSRGIATLPPLKRNSSTMGKLGKRMARPRATFTTCKEIHFVKCIRTSTNIPMEIPEYHEERRKLSSLETFPDLRVRLRSAPSTRKLRSVYYRSRVSLMEVYVARVHVCALTHSADNSNITWRELKGSLLRLNLIRPRFSRRPQLSRRINVRYFGKQASRQYQFNSTRRAHM